MQFRRSISLGLIVSQLGASALAWAAPAAAAPSPEFSFLKRVIALQGQNLNSTDLDQRLATIYTGYVTASANLQDGQQERLSQALVQLGVYTPEQAGDFLADTTRTTQSMSVTSTANQQFSVAVSTLADMHPVGAQFSGCDIAGGSTVVAAGGMGLFLMAIAGYMSYGSDQGPIYSANQKYGVSHDANLATSRPVFYAGAALVGVAALAVTYAVVNHCSSED